MVILLSALAVVVAAILLGTWFVVGGGFALIYAATALAILSMVLLWAARWIGSTSEVAGPTEPEPLRELSPTSAAAPASTAVEPEARDEAVPAPVGSRTAAGEEPAAPPKVAPVAGPREAADGPDEGLPRFPIAEYDTLWVAQIVPLLAELDDDELAVVEARERGGRHRAAVLDAIEAVRAGEPVPESARPSARPAEVHAAPDADEVWAPAPADDAPSGVLEEPSPEELAEEEQRWAAWAEVAPPLADVPVDPDPVAEAEAEAEADATDAEPEPDPAPEVVEHLEPGVDDEDGERPAPIAADAEPPADIEVDPALFDWTQPEDEPDPREPPPADDRDAPPAVEANPRAEVEVEGRDDGDDDGWDADEPDGWDWSGVRDGAKDAEPTEPVAPQPVAVGGPRVRTFLGRRRSPVIVQRDDR